MRRTHHPRRLGRVAIDRDTGFTAQGRSGPNSVRFTGVLSRGKRLAPGSYGLTATPTDIAHNSSQPRTAKLTITAN